MANGKEQPCTNCPKCDGVISRVTDVRSVVIAGRFNSRRRRRVCLTCKASYSTFEVVAGSMLDLTYQEQALDRVIERTREALAAMEQLRHAKSSASRDVALAGKEGASRASSPDEIKAN